MKLKTKYILFILFTHIAFLSIAIVIYQFNKNLFLICEIILILSLIASLTLFKALFKPFKLLNAGIESMADKDFSIKFLPVGNKELDKLIEVFNNMTDQLRNERTKTVEKHFFLQKMIEATPTGIIILDINKKIESINPFAQNLLEFPHGQQINEISVLPPPWNSELLNLKENNTCLIQLNGINHFKCYKSYFLDRGVKRTFYLIEELTKELLNAEKQAYEKVIRMISHEVNNSVGSVNSIIDSSINYMQKLPSSSNDDFINALSIAKERIINLNKFTKKFADIVRIPPPELQECNLHEIIARVLFYFKKEFAEKNITINELFAPHDLIIPFDFQQFELVLINCIKNASDAIIEDGIITIKTTLQPATLIIENNGAKISADIQKRLFEPFFTTKKTGQGIGLTLIREILINHNANFSLKTRANGITEFKVIFQEE